MNAEACLSAPVSDVKAPSAFRTISEVANNLEVPQHVLRFWESKFQQIRPLKRAGGRRYYRPEDVKLLSNIKELLYTQGLTIRGVQKLLKETGRGGIVRPSEVAARSAMEELKGLSEAGNLPVALTSVGAQSEAGVLSSAARNEVEVFLTELKSMRDLLRQVGV
ncbi:MAG: MerR family transcriptional regulator [Alphaproteobacteria bacterium]|nr:MerR family transcriptional regulator [Alphaproteobacteria bacterium]